MLNLGIITATMILGFGSNTQSEFLCSERIVYSDGRVQIRSEYQLASDSSPYRSMWNQEGTLANGLRVMTSIKFMTGQPLELHAELFQVELEFGLLSILKKATYEGSSKEGFAIQIGIDEGKKYELGCNPT
ncbi:MAG: hypothetical protein COV44_11935 [Deltaproteobacteria bacterium CG11_big_fil_rev_8_21_14_0_20_45_16]|nr:MAG: hypothetical protein COV44_11935 [Deltaproteobacteria bacterium CG11_big_fil_rev_8_21_14_0_20_45_16]